MDDPFARPHDERPVGKHYLPESSYQPTLPDKAFQTRPRLVPMGLVAVAPIYTLMAAIFVSQVVNQRLKDVDESGLAWQVGMTVLAVLPGIAVCLMPLVQRRHLTHPEPFYTYCRRVTLAIAVGYPPLSIIAWTLGPADPVHHVFLLYSILGMYVTVMSLLPWAARLNHAAWLRAGGNSTTGRY